MLLFLFCLWSREDGVDLRVMNVALAAGSSGSRRHTSSSVAAIPPLPGENAANNNRVAPNRFTITQALILVAVSILEILFAPG